MSLDDNKLLRKFEYRMARTTEIQVLENKDLPYEFQYPQYHAVAGFMERIGRFMQWCIDNKVFYYARTKEEFSRGEAFQLAEDAGCNKIILDELPQ